VGGRILSTRSEISHIFTYHGIEYYAAGYDNNNQAVDGPAEWYNVTMLWEPSNYISLPIEVTAAIKQFLNNNGFAGLTLTEYIKSLGL
jgi:hypothetical protein